MADGRFFDVTVFSDVSARDGLGWALSDVAPAPGRGEVFEVFRSDAGTVPTIAGTTLQPVAPDLVERFAKTAVLDLLHGVLREGRTDWLPANIARALSWAGRRVTGWWGPEWPLSERADGTAKVYADAGADAVPFAWLGLSLDTGDVEVGIYQDDTYFGLHFVPRAGDNLRDYDAEYFRIHDDLPLPTGLIQSVTLTLDTTVLTDPAVDAILSEAVLVVDGRPVPLIAAEAYGPDEWHRLDESVVVLRDLETLQRTAWITPRPFASLPPQPGKSTRSPDFSG